MWYVNGTPIELGDIFWSYQEITSPQEEDGVRIGISLSSPNQYQPRQVIKTIEKILKEHPVPWIWPGRKKWTFDLDKLKETIPELSKIGWFSGKVTLEPELEFKQRKVFGKTRYEVSVAFYMVQEDLGEYTMTLEPPIEIKESLERFKNDHPDPTKVAFIMMQFGETKAHDEIVKAIRTALKSHGIKGVRADDKQYHDYLFPNVMTYLYGCNIGIAVFERIVAEEFNPNVSLEVGYMFALNKPVCLLKDKTLNILHTDLVGKLYKEFDPQDPINTIPDEITRWLKDKSII